MAVLRFRNFEELDLLERQGKGITYNFRPSKDYYNKALNFSVKRSGPAGVHRFGTFEEATQQEMKWIIQHATQ
jgi:hypothetical protein